MQAQIGIMIEGQDGLNWHRWQRILQAAEDFGYQCVFRSDHFTNASGEYKDALELWTSLTYAASHTKRIEFGPMVTPITFRHPSVLVKAASAVSDLSGGRLVLGMGIGWQEREHHNFGIPFPDKGVRYEMLTDALEIVTRLYNSSEPIHYHGKHFSVHDAVLMPKETTPPILIGGNGPEKTLALAAQYASEWNAVYLDHATYRERTQQLNALLAARGRQPSDVKRSLMTQVVYEPTDAALKTRLETIGRTAEQLQTRGLIVGTGAAVVDQIGAWVELGIQRFTLQWLDQDNIAGLEGMAKAVLPHFHTAS